MECNSTDVLARRRRMSGRSGSQLAGRLAGRQEQYDWLRAHQRHLQLLTYRPCGRMCRQTCGCNSDDGPASFDQTTKFLENGLGATLEQKRRFQFLLKQKLSVKEAQASDG